MVDFGIQEQQSKLVTIGAPTGGWNTKDPINNMPENDAIVLENIFPDTSGCKTRRGYTEFADTEETGYVVETLAEYYPEDSADKEIIAFVNKTSYIIEEESATEKTLSGTISSNQWSCLNFNNKLHICNGVNNPQYFDGASWTANNWTTITDDATLIHVNSYKQRLYYIEKDTQKVWYGDTLLITGDLTSLDLSTVLQLGGPLLYSLTWSYDTGAGPEQMFVVISTAGEVLVYAGSYPGDVATWSLALRFVIPPPLGRKSYISLGTDIIIVTKEGLVSLATMMRGGAISSYVTLTDKINSQFVYISKTKGSLTGWCSAIYPKGNYLVINVPYSVTIDTGQITKIGARQYVMNTLTGAWCSFTNQQAAAWLVSDDALYFGGNDGKIYLADTGRNDNGNGIPVKLQNAFTYLGDPQSSKQFLLGRLFTTGTDSISNLLSIDVNFSLSGVDSTTVIAGLDNEDEEAPEWDSAVWDVSYWNGYTIKAHNDWYTLNGHGLNVSPKFGGVFKNAFFELSAIGIVYESGGIL